MAKNNQDNQTESITLCNVYFFEKKIYTLYSGAKPQKLENFPEFCVKSNLKVCNLLLTISYRERSWGSRMY